MINEQGCRSLIDTAIAHGRGKADGIEAWVTATDVATARFANNEMTQNQAPECTELSVRVLVNGRQARLTTDDLSPKAVRNLVDNATLVAGFLEQDPGLLPLLEPCQITPSHRFDARTAGWDALRRAKAAKVIIDVARHLGLCASGVVATGTTTLAVGNSQGLFAYHKESGAECSITMTAADSSGWVKWQNPKASLFDAESLAQAAAEKAIASANPVEIEAGRYTVILEPSAVLDLLGFLWYDFSATSHHDQRSCFLNEVGKKVLGDNITIFDDAFHPLQAGPPFDGEGMPRQKLTLIDRGVIKDLAYGRRAARKESVKPTGHGLQEPTSMGEQAVNIVVQGGDSSLAEMIGSTERGLLLTRVWYVREVDPAIKIVTGMTRDGTFLVENGKIAHGVKNLRFNESLLAMLNNVEALSEPVRAAGEESFPAVVPAMKVKDFNFSSTTRF